MGNNGAEAIMFTTNGAATVGRIMNEVSIQKTKYNCGWDNDWDKSWDEGPWDKESWSDYWDDSHH